MKMKFKTFLAINLTAAAVIPIILAGMLLLYFWGRSIEQEITNRNRLAAIAVSRETERFLREPLDALLHLRIIVDSMTILDKSDLNSYLQTAVSSYEIFDALYLIDTDGTVRHLAPYNPDMEGIDMSGTLFFKALKHRSTPHWSETFISLQTGDITLTLALPFKEFIVSANLNLQYLSTIVDNLRIGKAGYVSIVDNKGVIIAHPKKQLVAQRHRVDYLDSISRGKQFSYLKEETKMAAISEKVSFTGWNVVVQQPEEEIFLEIRWIRWVLFVIIFIATTLAAFIAFTVSRRVFSPLNQLTENMRLMSDGKYMLAPLKESFEELQQIFNIFEEMALAIRGREEELRSTSHYLDTIFESMGSIMIGVNMEGSITRWNRAAENEQWPGHGLKKGEQLWRMNQIFQFHREKITKGIFGKEEVFLRRVKIETPALRYLDITVIPLGDESKPGAVIRIDDVTEYEMNEIQLRQAQKMETVGTLAGGLAHDFNNVLGGITGSLTLMEHLIKKGTISVEKLSQLLKTACTSAKRAGDIVKQLLTLSRRYDVEFVLVDIKKSLSNVIKICSSSLPKSVTIVTELPGEPCNILGDPVQMEQTLLNIIVNSSHSMTIMRKPEEHQGGLINVSVKRIRSDRHLQRLFPDSTAGTPYWLIEIKDEGVGMSEEVLNRIFEPFFTTKAEKRVRDWDCPWFTTS